MERAACDSSQSCGACSAANAGPSGPACGTRNWTSAAGRCLGRPSAHTHHPDHAQLCISTSGARMGDAAAALPSLALLHLAPQSGLARPGNGRMGAPCCLLTLPHYCFGSGWLCGLETCLGSGCFLQKNAGRLLSVHCCKSNPFELCYTTVRRHIPEFLYCV